MPGSFYLVKVLYVSVVFMDGAYQNSFSNYKIVKMEMKIYLVEII